MAHELFSDAWAGAMREALARHEPYRLAAADWEGALVLGLVAAHGAEVARGVWLDLHRGECRAARAMDRSDLESAPFVVAGPAAVWSALLAGSADPLGAVMRGQLRLVRGSLARLLPHAEAARQLVVAARCVPTHLPEETA